MDLGSALDQALREIEQEKKQEEETHNQELLRQQEAAMKALPEGSSSTEGDANTTGDSQAPQRVASYEKDAEGHIKYEKDRLGHAVLDADGKVKGILKRKRILVISSTTDPDELRQIKERFNKEGYADVDIRNFECAKKFINADDLHAEGYDRIHDCGVLPKVFLFYLSLLSLILTIRRRQR